MKLRIYGLMAIVSLGAALAMACQGSPKPAGQGYKETEAIKFVKGMGLGYNLGNTMDAAPGSRANLAEYETAWGAPLTNKRIFEDLKSRGFNCVRIPVAWSNLRGENYTIDPGLMDRVDEITQMAVDSGMYAIVNIHWDYGWILDFPSNYNETMTRYKRYWDQISERFNKYDEKVIFESLNEEGYFNDVWNRYAGGGDDKKKQKAFDILNTVNQTFVDLVRAKGGNNAKRYLLIAGYATDLELTCDKFFRMPKDKIGRQIVSVHYYTPPTFSIISEDVSWGKSAYKWGTPAEVERVTYDLVKLRDHFFAQGVPVIIGEYGTAVKNKEPESVRKYLKEVATVTWKLGMCPVLWAGATDVYNREKLAFDDPLIGDMFLALSKTPR